MFVGINFRLFGHQRKVKMTTTISLNLPLWVSEFIFLNFTGVQLRDNTGEVQIFTSQLQSINAERAEGSPWGDLFSIEDRTPPQGLLSLENKSCEIFVIHPPLFYFRKRADTSALWSTPFPATTTLYNHQGSSLRPSVLKSVPACKGFIP